MTAARPHPGRRADIGDVLPRGMRRRDVLKTRCFGELARLAASTPRSQA